ncbi:MAG TPA: ABC transporter ATP-binding protein [Candidatus Acidoferrales bacterium]|nr:ABC transporter ATP-binding protein [Candidatus Acidoferrales bacterium]
MEYAIQARDLSKSYGEGHSQVDALKDISMAVQPGELFAIMGPSGSGKTTLLMILGLVTEPSEGSVLLEGKSIYEGKRFDLQRLRREKIGFIFQFSNLIPFLTAKENVLLSLELVDIVGRQADKRATELLAYLEVANRADNLPEQLSGGERQRVAVARALANNPAIILADEPTAALDTERGLSVMRLLRKVSKEQGTAILVVTHDTRMISEVDGVIHLMDGRMVEDSDSQRQLQSQNGR